MAKEKEYINEEEFNETNVYDEEGREDLVEDDEMSAEEEGFMKGYEDANEQTETSEEEKEE